MTTTVSPVDRLLIQMAEIVDLLEQQVPYVDPNARAIYDECARHIHLATMETPGYPPRQAYRIGGHVYRIEPTSCACGGSYAWLRERDTGAWEMVGCICHHTPMKQGETI